MIPQITMYIMSAVILTRIVPTTIDNVPVFPTNAAVIAEEPTQDYRWETIELPNTWPLDTYYIELWDARNQPIPGHTATKLVSHTIDISDIDATLTPSVRAVIFQPPNSPAPPADYAIYFHYETFPNYRLMVLMGGAAVGLMLLLVWSLHQKRQLLQLPQAITGLLRGHFTTAYLAVVCTVLFAGVFGAILGSFIGGIQIIYVLVKLPFLMGAALLISFTTLLVLSWLTGVKATVKETWIVALNLLAITAIGLCSFSSILGFYIVYPLGHDQVLIATILFFLAAGLLALVSLYRWQRKLLLPMVWVVVYGMVFMQLGWMLRPWVGVIDPVHETVPIARANSGNVFAELINTLKRLD